MSEKIKPMPYANNKHLMNSLQKPSQMEKTKHDKIIASFHQITDEVIKEYLTVFKPFCTEEDINNGVLALLEKKLSQSTPVRPFFVRKMYDYLKSEKNYGNQYDNIFKAKIPLVFEVIICVQYYDNQILDRKAHVTSKKKIQENLRASKRLKELLYQYLRYGIKLHGKSYDKIKHYVDKIFLYVDIGQKIERKFNHFQGYQKRRNTDFDLVKFLKEYLNDLLLSKKWKKEKDLIDRNIEQGFFEFGYFKFTRKKHIGKKKTIKKIALDFSNYINKVSKVEEIKDLKKVVGETDFRFLESFFQRQLLTTGYLYSMVPELILDLFEMPNHEREHLRFFTTYFSLTRQNVNDNTDCIPDYFKEKNRAKSSEDAFSDFKNSNITLPFFLHLQNPSNWPRLVSFKLFFFIPYFFRSSWLLSRYNSTIKFHIFKDLMESFALPLAISFGKSLGKSGAALLNKQNPHFDYLAHIFLELSHNNRYYRHVYDFPVYQNKYKKIKKNNYQEDIFKMMAITCFQPMKNELNFQTFFKTKVYEPLRFIKTWLDNVFGRFIPQRIGFMK